MSEKDDVKPLRVQNWTAADDGITPDDLASKARLVPRDKRIVSARLKPHISTMLNDAYDVVYEEMKRMKVAQQEGGKISPDRIDRLARTLKNIQHMEIEEEKREKPVDMADEELIRPALKDRSFRDLVRKLLREYDD